MRDGETRATFTINTLSSDQVEVLGESRTIVRTANHIEDLFKGYEVHLYRISMASR